MNKVSKIIEICSFFCISMVLIVVYMFLSIYDSCFGLCDCIILFSVMTLLLGIQNCCLVDLDIVDAVLIETSIFRRRKINVDCLELLDIRICRTPYFLLNTNKQAYRIFYTKRNYEILKKLVDACKTNFTMDYLDRLVKKYIIPLK